jgi:hypothetical protein
MAEIETVMLIAEEDAQDKTPWSSYPVSCVMAVIGQGSRAADNSGMRWQRMNFRECDSIRMPAKQQFPRPLASWMDGFNLGAWFPAIHRGYIIALLLGLLFVQFVPQLSAENLYVTPSGAGSHTGADWNNAFAGFAGVAWGSGPHQLGAGDILWVAGGSYTTVDGNNAILTIKGSGSAGSPIAIKRCLSSNTECISAAGWKPEYDSQVILSGAFAEIYLYNPNDSGGNGRYITIDGQITDGIRVNMADGASYRGMNLYCQGSTNTTIRYVGFYGPQTDGFDSYLFLNSNWLMELHGSSDPTKQRLKDLTIEHCTIAGAHDAAMLESIDGLTIQYCDVHTLGSDARSEQHIDGFFNTLVDHLIFRYNVVHDSDINDGALYYYTGNSVGHYWPSKYHYIYGNIFRDFVRAPASNAIIKIKSGDIDNGPFYVWGNTVVGVNYFMLLGGPLATDSMSYAQNNLFVDVDNPTPATDPNLTVDHQITKGSESQFVSWNGTHPAAPFNWQNARDLHLATSTSSAGTTLSSPYSVDMDGKTRGADGFWDIGAYEEFAKIPPPSNLRIIKFLSLFDALR